MSRYYFDKKNLVEDSLDIDVFWLKKHGYFIGYKHGGITWSSGSGRSSSISISVQTATEPKYIQFSYSLKDRSVEETTNYEYKVSIVTSGCRYGGVRYWFLCPLTIGGISCGRRVAKLYLAPNAKYFGCRICHDLTYDSRQSHNKNYDLISKMFSHEKRSEKLHKQIKRKYYKDRPTKKYLKFLKYCSWLDDRGPLLERELSRMFKSK